MVFGIVRRAACCLRQVKLSASGHVINGQATFQPDAANFGEHGFNDCRVAGDAEVLSKVDQQIHAPGGDGHGEVQQGVRDPGIAGQ